MNVVCAPGTPSSGLDALAKAGVSYQTTQRFPGFVCRIAGKPSNDPCVNTSPASAYWAYWLAAPGGSWCYSTLGAGSRKPPRARSKAGRSRSTALPTRSPRLGSRLPRAGRIAAGRAQRQRLPVDAHHAARDHDRARRRPRRRRPRRRRPLPPPTTCSDDSAETPPTATSATDSTTTDSTTTDARRPPPHRPRPSMTSRRRPRQSTWARMEAVEDRRSRSSSRPRS